MLGEAVGQVKGLQGTAAQKADLFGGLAKQITQQSRGGWNAARGVRADGSHIQHFSLVDVFNLSGRGGQVENLSYDATCR